MKRNSVLENYTHGPQFYFHEWQRKKIMRRTDLEQILTRIGNSYINLSRIELNTYGIDYGCGVCPFIRVPVWVHIHLYAIMHTYQWIKFLLNILFLIFNVIIFSFSYCVLHAEYFDHIYAIGCIWLGDNDRAARVLLAGRMMQSKPERT